MPFPHEHAARQHDPSSYDHFRRGTFQGIDGVDVIWGITSAGKTEIQSFRFDASAWTPSRARDWLKAHNFKTGIEEATMTSTQKHMTPMLQAATAFEMAVTALSQLTSSDVPAALRGSARELAAMARKHAEEARSIADAMDREGYDEVMAQKAVWDTAFVNDLPDGAFLFVETGGTKDPGGKTVPRSLRHFPYKDSSGAVDLAHLRNALARIPVSNLPSAVKDRLTKEAQAILERENAKAGS